MSSWLKAAEDLFEVVDRRAKLVVSELADEQSDSQLPAANGNGSHAKKRNSKSKGQRRVSTNEPPKQSDTAQDQPGTPSESKAERRLSTNEPPKQSDSAQEKPGTSSEYNEPPDKDKPLLLAESNGISPSSSLSQTHDNQDVVDEEPSTLDANFPDKLQIDVNNEPNNTEIQTTEALGEAEISTLDDEPAKEIASDPVEPANELILSPSPTTRIEPDGRDKPIEVVQSIESRDVDVFSKVDEEKIQSLRIDSNGDASEQLKDVNSVGPQSALTKDEEPKVHDSPKKVQEQLDEAQGLLKSTKTTGQSKEARLARVCAGLSSRLQEYKSENAQLEELLVAEKELTKSYEAHIKQLQHEISSCKTEAARVESNMVEALAAKNSEIESLVSSIDALKNQAALSEGNLSSLQANMESLMRNRELTETRMMQALREELASAERRAEEERAAHNATKMAAMEREAELEHRAVDSSTALARIQRIADERTAKAADLDQKVALLEVECASLNQELQDMEARTRRGQKKSSEEANQAMQIQAWQEEVERARLGQREAENKLSLLEAEAQKMRVEMAAMRRDAEHYSRQEHMELEKRYRELTDLLYYKQTQLETIASEKAAAEFQLEKEMKRLHEAKAEAERGKISQRASTSWEEDTDLRTLEPLPLHHRHMARASIQLQKAAKFLDSGAVRATRFLWRYPTARVILLFYLVFVHLFLMYLLHRLQAQADSFASREFESMGLGTNTLP